MEKFKIIIPVESEEEEKMLKKASETVEGIQVSPGQTRNLDGLFSWEIVGQAEQLINLIGAIASIYSVLCGTKVQIYSNDKKIRGNIRLIDLYNYLKNLIK